MKNLSAEDGSARNASPNSKRLDANRNNSLAEVPPRKENRKKMAELILDGDAAVGNISDG